MVRIAPIYRIWKTVMKMYFYRGMVPNFGDELNHWLLPKVFPNFFDEDDATLFLGIGSILFDSHPKHSRKIVFGSGYGGYTPKPEIDDKWKFYCVRGPRTAAAFHLGPDKVAGDSAILISKYFKRSHPNPAGHAFMPHFESIDRGNWQRACEMAGIKFIDPRDPIEDVLASLDQCAVLITEAMHGAIVADAIRVPWVPVLPFQRSHHMKWFDWAEPLDLTLRREIILPSSFAEAASMLHPLTRRMRPLWRRMSTARADDHSANTNVTTEKSGIGKLDHIFIHAAAASLKRAMKQVPTLSKDAALSRVLDKLETQSHHIRQDFAERNGNLN
jgi:succinoglycan biosynthesis protein ExoV